MTNEQKFKIFVKLLKEQNYFSSYYNHLFLARDLATRFPCVGTWACESKHKEIKDLWPLDINKENSYDTCVSFHIFSKNHKIVVETKIYDSSYSNRVDRGNLRCTFIITLDNYDEKLDKYFEDSLESYTYDIIEKREKREKEKLFKDTKQELINILGK